jgi:hypothetical protein
MCRSIHTLYNIESPVTEEEIHSAALQYVRKISGYHKSSKSNEAAFLAAVREVEATSIRLLTTLTTSASLREHQRDKSSRPAQAFQVQPIHQVEA